MGEKIEIKTLEGKLGPGPGGYFADKPKNADFRYS